MENKINKKQILILIAIYLLALSIRIYWLSQKEGFHADEGMSITLACNNEYMWTKNYDFYVEYTGKELKEISLCSDDSIRGLFNDIYYLWIDSKDSPHTNMYYSFLRLSLAGLKTGELKTIIIRGGILNLIFFTISFIFFFLIMRLLFPESILLQFTATVCAFLSTATISNTLFLRPYQIQETMFVIFCFCFIKSLNNKITYYVIHENKLYFNIKQLFLFSFITGITLLTGYYTIIYISLFGLFIIYKYHKTINHSHIVFYIIVLILGLLFAQTFYSKYLRGFFSYRTLEVNNVLFSNIFNNIKISILNTLQLLNLHFFSYTVIITCILSFILVLFYKQKFRSKNITIIIFLVSLSYIIIILLIAPYKTLRYIMPVFPFLIILPTMIINTLYKKRKLIAYITMLILFACFFINSLNQNNIEHIYRDKSSQYIFTKDKNTPVVIFNNSYWKYNNLIPYLNNEQIYYFIEKQDDIYLCPYDEFYYVYEYHTEVDINTDRLNAGKTFEILGLHPEIYSSGRFFKGVRLSLLTN